MNRLEKNEMHLIIGKGKNEFNVADTSSVASKPIKTKKPVVSQTPSFGCSHNSNEWAGHWLGDWD